MHDPIESQGQGLRLVVTGVFRDHAVPTNDNALGAFRHHVMVLWMRSLRRRSQRDRTTWQRMERLFRSVAPEAAHPPPLARKPLRRQTPEVGARCPNWARRDPCGGGAQ